jgi:hypothetical protein
VGAYRITNSWTEGTGTTSSPASSNVSWNHRTGTTNWTTSGGDIAGLTSSVNITSNNSWTGYWDVTSDVQAFVNGTYTNNGWLLKLTTSSDISLQPRAREYSGTTYDPQLEVTYY